MADINTIFHNVYASTLGTINFVLVSTRNEAGDPIFEAQSNENIPIDVEMRTLLYPEIYPMSVSELAEVFDPSSNERISELTQQSGCIFGYRGPAKTENIFTHTYITGKSGENTKYSFAYQAKYHSPDTGIEVFNSDPVITGISVLSKVKNPDPKNIQLVANLTAVDTSNTDLHLTLNHSLDVVNSNLSDPYAYRVFIVDEDRMNYSISGVQLPGGVPSYENFQEESTFNFVLPYKYGSDPVKNYKISLFYYDQNGATTKELNFDTKLISKTNDDWNTGQEIDSFDKKKLSSKKEIVIKNDVHTKKRYSIGLDDIGIINESFVKHGIYESDYYTIDDPLYTFAMKAEESIPDYGTDIVKYERVKYFVQFHNQDWIRVSPINRNQELDETGKTIPKFLILDNLNMGGLSAELSELPYDFPVFSFKIKIEFDLEFQQTNNFISPAIDYYECYVTDRKSFLRI